MGQKSHPKGLRLEANRIKKRTSHLKIVIG